MLEYYSLTMKVALGLPVKRYTDRYIDFFYTHRELGIPWIYTDNFQDHYYNVEIVKLNEERLGRDGPFGPFPSDGRYFRRVRIRGPSSLGISIYCDEVASTAPPVQDPDWITMDGESAYRAKHWDLMYPSGQVFVDKRPSW